LKYCFLLYKIHSLPDLPSHQSLIRLKKSLPTFRPSHPFPLSLPTGREALGEGGAWAKIGGKEQREVIMAMMTVYHPVLSLVAGILILILPRLLNYIVAIYLIIAGLVGLIR
jgi:hypothetical protein